MAANTKRLIELAMPPELAKEVAAQIDANLPVEPGSIVNADIAADAAIATTKLASGTAIAALVADATPLAALADVETELSTVAAAVTTPAAYSEVAADLSAVLVAAGLMEADV